MQYFVNLPSTTTFGFQSDNPSSAYFEFINSVPQHQTLILNQFEDTLQSTLSHHAQYLEIHGSRFVYGPDSSLFTSALQNFHTELHPPHPTPSSSPSTLPGDFNGDGHVNLADYNSLVSSYGTSYNLSHYNQLLANYAK